MSDKVWPVLAASKFVLAALPALQDVKEKVLFSSGSLSLMGESANRNFDVIFPCL
jgi:hypothetical protein